MQTKRYNIIFTGLDEELFSENRLSEIWEKEADAVYLESGIYISARLDISYFICGKIRNCDLGGLSASFVSLKDPLGTETEEQFYSALLEVVRRVRKKLGNPYMGVSAEAIEFYYFVSV